MLIGCTIMPRTADLRIGMTKEEAIKVMGTPSSVSAQANYEYLNYTLSESSGYMTMNRPYYIRLVDGKVESYGFTGQFAIPIVRTVTTPGRPEINSAPPAGRAIPASSPSTP
jgi:hypothetical protein